MLDEELITDEEIKRFNNKINRYTNREVDYLPEKLEREKINEMSETEQIRLKQEITDFLKRDSLTMDKNIGASKFFKNSYQRAYEALEEMKENSIKELDLSTEKGTMGAINKLNLRPKANRFESMTDKQRLQSFWGMQAQLNSTPDDYKEHYIKALDTVFGKDSAEYNLIKDVVDKIDSKELWLLYGEDSDLQLDFVYTEGTALEDKAQVILDAFYQAGYLDEKPSLSESYMNEIKNMYDI